MENVDWILLDDEAEFHKALYSMYSFSASKKRIDIEPVYSY